MTGFVSQYTNRLDAKGRVSVPAQFRATLIKDGFEGIYCFPSPFKPAVDVGGNDLISEIQKRLEGLTTLTPEHDSVSTAFFGNSETLKIDKDGRVLLSETIKAHAKISDSVTFVGQGYKFQIWEPNSFQVHQLEALKNAKSVLRGETLIDTESNNNREVGK